MVLLKAACKSGASHGACMKGAGGEHSTFRGQEKIRLTRHITRSSNHLCVRLMPQARVVAEKLRPSQMRTVSHGYYSTTATTMGSPLPSSPEKLWPELQLKLVAEPASVPEHLILGVHGLRHDICFSAGSSHQEACRRQMRLA